MEKREKISLTVKVIRSSRRKEMVGARIVSQELLVYLPNRLSEEEEKNG